MRAMVMMVIAALLLASDRAYPDDAAHCAELMKFGIYDKYKTFTSEYQYKQIKSFFSSYQFSSRQAAEAKANELGLDIIDILSLNFNGKSSSSSFELWQQELLKSTYEEAIHSGLKIQSVEKISEAMTKLIATCLTHKGVHAYIVPAPDNQSFSFTLDFLPQSSKRPFTKGYFTITPSSVASTCMPKEYLDKKGLEIGPQGVSVSLKRLPTETVTIVWNTDEGSGTIRYDAYVTPKPTISFEVQDDTVQMGKSTKIVWNVQNAKSVELDERGQVQDSGSLEVKPTADKEYRLKVTSLDGQVISSFVLVKVAPAPPTLASARVQFRTTNDNKDDDTHVTVNLLVGSATVASVSGQWGEFPDNTDSGWKDLTLVERPRKDAIIGVGRLQLIEAPNGHDEWHFNWTLELNFSDGSTQRFDWSRPDGVDYDRTTIVESF
ncbi:hypothetical protein P12x_000052 [Tundrisphaera lichenicola]|uniref:hypothetical protein n=1 Tax=Tundrisphaera lichenicola TaxID=2029860 RepID=UPI003EBAAD5D